MGFNIETLAYDPEKERGVWVNQYGEAVTTPNPEELELLIAPMGSMHFEHSQARQLRKNRRLAQEIAEMDADPVKTESIMINSLVEHCLLDWRHMEDDDGKEIPYSKEKARELLLTHRRFLSMVRELAARESLFTKSRLEQAEKNSPVVSAGKSSGAMSDSGDS